MTVGYPMSTTTDGHRVGLMLYSVRDAGGVDLHGTLREVADIGYEGVELFDLHGHEPETVRAWLDELGLVACARHCRLEEMESSLPALADEARALGWTRLVISWVDPAELHDGTLARIAAVSRAAQAAGLELGYHNHDAEVSQGFLDRLPEGVFVELDAGWAWWAGTDPVSLLGRGPIVHIKDMASQTEHTFSPVGDGLVGYERVAPAVVDAGTEWLMVEQDRSAGSELADARRSFDALQRFLGGV
jgi:sugar phosphate isomerase/epimerase